MNWKVVLLLCCGQALSWCTFPYLCISFVLTCLYCWKVWLHLGKMQVDMRQGMTQAKKREMQWRSKRMVNQNRRDLMWWELLSDQTGIWSAWYSAANTKTTLGRSETMKKKIFTQQSNLVSNGIGLDFTGV